MPAIVVYRLLLAFGALVLGFCSVAAIAEPALIAERLGIEATAYVTAGGVIAMAAAIGALLMAHREYA